MQAKQAIKLEDLKDKSGSMLSLIFEYLLEEDPTTGKPRMWQLMQDSKLKDIAVVYGITTEKFLLTQGQPTNIVAHQEYKTLDALTEKFLLEAKRRGLAKRPVVIEAKAQPPA